MLTKIKKFYSFEEKILLVNTFLHEIFFAFYIYVFGFKSLKKLILSKKLSKKIYNKEQVLKCERIISRNFRIKKCLTRMSTIYFFLKKFKYDCDLVIGVKDYADIRSHCWIETSGEIIDFGNRKDYKEIYRF